MSHHQETRPRPPLKRWRRALLITLIALLGLPIQQYSRAFAQEDKRLNQEVISLTDDLLRHLSSKVRAVIEGWMFRRLTEAVKAAHAAYEQGDACAAARHLETLLELTANFQQQKRSEVLEDVFNRVWSLRQNMLESLPAGKSCEGAGRFNQVPQTEISEADNKQLIASVSFGEPKLSSVEVDGELFTQLELPGIDGLDGEPGLPAVPVYRQLIALPHGAKAEVRVKAADGRKLKMKLYPVQPQPLDQRSGEKPDLEDPPFTINKEAYASDDNFPREIARINPIGKARDLNLAQLEIAAGQYNPASETMQLFESVEMYVQFEGGNGAFLSRTSDNDFSRQNVFAEAVLNHSILEKYRFHERIRFRLGEEFMILTPPAFRTAADNLAAWKNSKGISTRVFEVADGSGPGPDTTATIDALIENEYNRSIIAPSYVLLLGDAEFIPPFYRATSGSDTTGTDYPYALLGETDLVPDFALGRIPVDTLDQANTVVDKIINYEKFPPFSRSFYRNASLASQFQCCRSGSPAGRDERSFIETSELARNTLIGYGYNAERIYTRTGSDTPRRYYNGTLLPSDLGVGSGFAWDGSTDDIVNAFNAGRFLIVHRDHGWKYGWGHPEFESTNVINDLHNGSLLPVVFSVNCASGLFDNETASGDYGTTTGEVYFAEHLLRKQNGGAVGMLGDTRDSPTWANSALMRGFFDAVWPNTLPTYGNSTRHRRLGDILNYGKCYLATQVGVAGTTEAPSNENFRSEAYLWHVIGDPTLEMWTANPRRFPDILAEFEWKWWNRLAIKLPIEEAIVTVFEEVQGGLNPIGRAQISNGKAELNLVKIPRLGASLQISVSAENTVSETLQTRIGIF